MKTNLKSTVRLAALFIALALFGIKANAQECKSQDEKQVTNLEQVKDFMTFTHRSPIKNGDNDVIGFHYSASAAKGHRREGHCCNFNRGFCGRFSALDLSTDLQGNIVKANFTMFVGTTPDGAYLRFEGIEPEEDK